MFENLKELNSFYSRYSPLVVHQKLDGNCPINVILAKNSHSPVSRYVINLTRMSYVCALNKKKKKSEEVLYISFYDIQRRERSLKQFPLELLPRRILAPHYATEKCSDAFSHPVSLDF